MPPLTSKQKRRASFYGELPQPVRNTFDDVEQEEVGSLQRAADESLRAAFLEQSRRHASPIRQRRESSSPTRASRAQQEAWITMKRRNDPVWALGTKKAAQYLLKHRERRAANSVAFPIWGNGGRPGTVMFTVEQDSSGNYVVHAVAAMDNGRHVRFVDHILLDTVVSVEDLRSAMIVLLSTRALYSRDE